MAEYLDTIRGLKTSGGREGLSSSYSTFLSFDGKKTTYNCLTYVSSKLDQFHRKTETVGLGYSIKLIN